MLQGINLAREIRQAIDERIKRHFEGVPKTLPCIVASRKGGCVSVTLLIDVGYQAVISDIPILQSPYAQTPIKSGDMGVLIPFSFYSSSVVKNNLTSPQKKIDNTALGDWAFLPVLSDVTAEKETADLIFKSQNGGAKITINENTITLEIGASKAELTQSGIKLESGSGSVEIGASGTKINGTSLEVM